VARLRRGFVGQAESIAERIRADLGLANIVRLDPLALADDLEIPVLSLTALLALDSASDDLAGAVSVLRGAEQSALSALTVFRGNRRLVVYNDRNTVSRQTSDLAHELAHGLLLHTPAAALNGSGCRAWNTEIEDEASYLGGALLIPGKAARWIAKCGITVAAAAERFGCSIEMINWRLNESGARKLMRTR
jgi:Zn-dependent peptidase ImmA (M78 family)